MVQHYKSYETILKSVLVKLVLENASIQVEDTHHEEIPNHEVEVRKLSVSLFSSLYVYQLTEY